MFKHQGPTRSEKQNRLLAGYLAFIGGFVNSVGFVMLGNFTSHVTGNVARFASDVAQRAPSAMGALAMVFAFLVGAVVASLMIESASLTMPRAYAAALLAEAALLLVVVVASPHDDVVRIRDWETAALSAAMGMQNSLVTRLSGAVVRTTHLTGVVTDIGIEIARWLRWWRAVLSSNVGFALSNRNPERPSASKIVLLCTIAASFGAGAVGGSFAGMRAHHVALLAPVIALAGGALFAFQSGRERA